MIDFRTISDKTRRQTLRLPLLEAIQDRLAKKKEQVVLMLNRRGYSSFVMCRECGTVDTCPNCDISLDPHGYQDHELPLLWFFQRIFLRVCPNCKSRSIRYYGTGTQKAYDELAELFPQARILRMDVDTTHKKGSHQAPLDQFGRGKRIFCWELR